MRKTNGNWRINKSLWRKRKCGLEEEVLITPDHGSTHVDIFQTVTGINKVPETIVTETNR